MKEMKQIKDMEKALDNYYICKDVYEVGEINKKGDYVFNSNKGNFTIVPFRYNNVDKINFLRKIENKHLIFSIFLLKNILENEYSIEDINNIKEDIPFELNGENIIDIMLEIREKYYSNMKKINELEKKEYSKLKDDSFLIEIEKKIINLRKILCNTTDKNDIIRIQTDINNLNDEKNNYIKELNDSVSYSKKYTLEVTQNFKIEGVEVICEEQKKERKRKK